MVDFTRKKIVSESGFEFEFKERTERNRTATQKRVALSVTFTHKKYNYGNILIQIGHEIMDLLGWTPGDYVQLSEKGDKLAISRANGQYKLCARGYGYSQTFIHIQSNKVQTPPLVSVPVTELPYSIERFGRGKEKILLIPSSACLFSSHKQSEAIKERSQKVGQRKASKYEKLAIEARLLADAAANDNKNPKRRPAGKRTAA